MSDERGKEEDIPKEQWRQAAYGWNLLYEQALDSNEEYKVVTASDGLPSIVPTQTRQIKSLTKAYDNARKEVQGYKDVQDELMDEIDQLKEENDRLKRWDEQLRYWLIDHKVATGEIDLDEEPPWERGEKPVSLTELRNRLSDG